MGQAKPEWKSSARSTRAGPSEDSTHDSHVQLAELLNLSVYSQRRRHTKPPNPHKPVLHRGLSAALTRLRRYRSQTNRIQQVIGCGRLYSRAADVFGGSQDNAVTRPVTHRMRQLLKFQPSTGPPAAPLQPTMEAETERADDDAAQPGPPRAALICDDERGALDRRR